MPGRIVAADPVSLFFKRTEERASALTWATGDDALPSYSTDKALQIAATYACVKLITDSICTLPLHAYSRRPDGTRARIPLPVAISSPVGQGFTSAWVQRPLVSMLLHGNAYGLVTGYGATGWPSGVAWLKPTDVYLDSDAGQWYVKGRPVPRADILHIPALVVPGSALGVSPVGALARTFDSGYEAQVASGQWSRNRAVPGLKIRNSKMALTVEQADTAAARMKAKLRNGDPFVTGNDWDLDVLTIPAADEAFLGAIKANATQIASIYSVPPEMVGGTTGGSLTYNTVEQQAIQLLTYACRPWMVRLEEAISAFMMPRPQYVKFNADALIRVDTKTRHEIYQIDRNIGLRNIDELRALEDEEPLPDGQGQSYPPLAAKPATTSSREAS